MDNEMFSGAQDPFDRLEQMEEGLMNHAEFIQGTLKQVKEQGEMIVKLSEGMKELAVAMQFLQMEIDSLKIRMRVSEARNEIKK